MGGAMSERLLPGIYGRLHITLTEPPGRITPKLTNLKAPATATISAVKLEPYVYENGDSRALTEDELATVAFDGPEIVIRNLTGSVRHAAPSRAGFTVRDLLAAVEETERQTRGKSSWFGGVDVHHLFFEGLYLQEDGAWSIAWGS
jgi:hypothetical protein